MASYWQQKLLFYFVENWEVRRSCSASKRVKLVGAAQSLFAGITDALRTATIDHSKVFEVMALFSVMAHTISGKRH
jgi:hypothetical protein